MESHLSAHSEHAMFTYRDRRQVAALVVLLLVFAMTFGLGAARLYYQIRKPFAPKTALGENTKKDQFLTLIDKEALQKEELKTVDNDGDGLSDFDELYIYRTSPYVKDTDSDGEDDKSEVTQGKDPNCALGKQCGQEIMSPKEAEQQSEVSSQYSPSPTPSGTSAQYGMPDLNTITPQQIRELLIKQGVPQDALINIPDKELVEKFKQTVAKAQGEVDKSAAAQGSGVIQPPQSQVQTQSGFDPEKLSSHEIRSMLKQQSNISENQKIQIDKLDDATVKKLFLEAYTKTVQKKQTP